MTQVKTTYEGAAGAAITTANSGVNLIAAAGGATALFDTAAALDGATGATFTSDGSNAAYAQKNFAASCTAGAVSVGYTIPSAPYAADTGFATIYDTAGSRVLGLIFNKNGGVYASDKSSVQTQILTAAQAVAGTKFRFEIVVTNLSATAGAFKVTAYNASDVQVGATLNLTAANTGTTAMSFLRHGATQAAAVTAKIDSVQLDDGRTTEIGRLTLTPPSVSAGPDLTGTVNQPVTLSGTAGGRDGATITSVAWTYRSSPGTAPGFSAANSATTQTVPTQVGTYVARLTATDSNGLTAYDEMQFVVSAAAGPPTVNLAVSGPFMLLDARASTPGGGGSLTAAISPSTGVVVPVAGAFLVPLGTAPRPESVTVTESGSGQSDTASTTLPAAGANATGLFVKHKTSSGWTDA